MHHQTFIHTNMNTVVILYWLNYAKNKWFLRFFFFFSCCHLNLHGVGRSKRHWLILLLHHLLFMLGQECLLWNINLIPWVAASVNAIFPLQILVDKYLRISYWFLRLSHYNAITEAKKKFTVRQTATTKLQTLVIRF